MATIHMVPKAAGAAPPAPVVLIVSSAYASLPAPGNRVGPGDASNMPTIVASGISSAITAASGSSKYRLVGLEIKSGAGNNVTNLISMGGGISSEANLPADIIIDRCYIHNASGTSGRRGVDFNVVRGAVIDSYISGFREAGSDSQAILAWNTPGPLKVVNNYLEAASENFHVGGVDPAITNLVPSDIEFRRNYCFKPLSWVGAGYNVKNLFEVKNVQRILIEGNVFENNWADGQDGRSFLVTPRNQSNTAPWCKTIDITARYNKFVGVEGGINISGSDSDFSSGNTTRVTIKHNFLLMSYDGGAGNNKATQLVTSHAFNSDPHPTNVEMTNNTFIHGFSGGSNCIVDSAGVKITGFVFKNNVTTAGSYGLLGNSTTEGNATLTGHFTSPDYTYNVIIGSSNTGSYPATNQFPANVAAVSFTDTATNDYSLAGGSAYKNDGSDGADPGADWTTLNAKTLHSVDGAWGAADDVYYDRTYTNAELPRSYVDSTYMAQSGTTWNCATAAEFTAALASCAFGDTIVLQAGSTFTGNFTLRNI